MLVKAELGLSAVHPGLLVLGFDLQDAVADLDDVLVTPQHLEAALFGREDLQVLGAHLQGLVE